MSRAARPGVERTSHPATGRAHLFVEILTGALTALAAYAVTRRWLTVRAERRSALTDDAIREIERHGRLEREEPLDLEEVDAEERRFWDEEKWDESEEWPGA